MGFSYFNMWGLLILLALGAVGGALYRGDLIQTFRDAYPADVAKQEALRRCQQANPSFSKFSVDDRNNCYQAILYAVAMRGTTANW